MKRPIVRFCSKQLVKNSDVVIAQCAGMASSLRSSCDRALDVRTIRNPVPNMRVEGGQSDLGDYIDIVWVGSDKKQKRLDLIFALINRLAKETDRIRWTLVGVSNLTIPEELVSFVQTVGKVVSVLPILEKSDITISVSDYEGYPNASLESLSLGIPVISFDYEFGPREFIQEGKNGFLVFGGDLGLMRSKVLDFMNFGVEWTREEIARDILSEHSMEKWEQLWREVLSDVNVCHKKL